MRKTTLLLITLFTLSFQIEVTFGQTVIATYEIHDHASGLAYDGSNIWYGRYGTEGEKIYKFNIALSQVVDSLDLGSANLDDSYGMTWDGQYLWVTNHVGSDFTLQLDTLGNIISSFPNPSDYMSGLAWNGSELYMGDYYNPDGAIYRVTTSGSIIESFTAPDTQPWDFAWDGVNLWMCDYWSDWIYQIDPVTHQVLFSFPSPITEPAGITWDGSHLWVCDEGQGYSIDHLYIIDPFGGGTPEIQLSATSYDFSFIPIGMTPSFTLEISNVGDADLSITGLPIDQFGIRFWVDSTVTLPLIVPPGYSENVDIFYGPLDFGANYAVLYVQSNDPINPEEVVYLSGYGIYPDQTVGVSANSINFGNVWVAGGDGMTGEPFEIYNLGAAPLNLESLVSTNPVFTISGFQPGILQSMDTLAVTVFFTPEQITAYNGFMILTTDDLLTPVMDISLFGQGIAASYDLGDIIWEYQVEEPATFTGFNSIIFMDDANGDGIPEALGANDNYNVYCLNGQSSGMADVFYRFDTGWDPWRTGDVEYERGMVSAPDLDGDDTGDFVIGTGGGSRTVFAVSGEDGSEIWQFDTHNIGGEGGWVYEVTCESDWDGDYIYDVLAAVGGPMGSSDPKSVFLLSGVDGSQIWRAALGETVYSVRLLDDVDNDRYNEVICGTSPYTGTYFVKMLNGQDGSVEWNTEVDNVVFSLNRIADLNGDGVDDAAVAAASGGVYALSGTDGSIIWHIPSTGTNYYLEVTEDLNNSGYDDVLVTSVSGTFYAYEGQNGSIIWSQYMGSNVLSLDAAPDVNGDGIADACCGIMNGSFYVVSGADGSTLFNYIHGGGSNYAFDAVGWLPDIDNSGACEFIGGTRDGHVYCFSGGSLSQNVEVSIEPVNPPIVIPAPGGSFDYLAQVSNTGNDPVSVDFWIMANLPSGGQVGPLLLRTDVPIPAGSSRTVTLTQYIPGYAPSGSYIYTAFIGNYDLNHVWDSDSFTFDKTGVEEVSAGDWCVTGWLDSPNQEVSTEHHDFALYAPTPNPFNPITVIAFQLPKSDMVGLDVFDVNGRLVKAYPPRPYSTGTHRITFDGSGLASGIYIYRLTTGNFTGSGKMIYLK